MDAYDAMFSATYVLNERIAQWMFEMLPEGGPLLALVDGSGHYWASDPEAFMQLNLVETLLDDLRAQVDDGLEPATVEVGDTMVLVTQLHTERTNCGYLVLAVPRHGAELSQTSLELIELLLSQVLLVASLVERCGLLSDSQAKSYGAYAGCDLPLN